MKISSSYKYKGEFLLLAILSIIHIGSQGLNKAFLLQCNRANKNGIESDNGKILRKFVWDGLIPTLKKKV